MGETYFQASPKLFHRTHTYLLILGSFVQGVRSSVQSDVKSHTTNKINSHSSYHFFLRIIAATLATIAKHQTSPPRRGVTRALAALNAPPGHAGSPLGSRRLSYADDHGDSSTDKGVGGSPMKKKDCVIADRQPKAFRPRIVAHNSVVAPPSIIHRSTTADSSPPTTEVRNNPSPSSVVYRGETTGLLVQADTAESYC